MESTPDLTLTTVREFERAGGDRRALARASTRGATHRVRRGVYTAGANWADLDPVERYYARCAAASLCQRSRPVLSHWSAAVVHGIPIIGPWPNRLHRLCERAAGGRSSPEMVAHPVRLDDAEVVEVDGILVTSFARTIVDLAAAATFASAVASADHALHRKRRGHLSAEDLSAAFNAARPMRAHRRIERVLDFATPLSDSPAESISRVTMFVRGFERPELQAEFSDAEGVIGAADFFWRHSGIVGEVDGRQKYIKPEYLNGRSPGEVVYQEKVREDRLRALPLKVVRWDWFRANDAARLTALLTAAGVPRDRP